MPGRATADLPVAAEILALVPPAQRKDSPGVSGRNYPMTTVSYAANETIASVSVARAQEHARQAGRYSITLQLPSMYREGKWWAGAQFGAYGGDNSTAAAARFRAVAWLLGAPYRGHAGAQRGIPAAEIGRMPFPAAVALDAAVRSFDVRSMLLDQAGGWGARWLIITVRSARLEQFDMLASALGDPFLNSLGGEPLRYIQDRFGIFVLEGLPAPR